MPLIPHLKDGRTPEQRARGVRRIDGHEPTEYWNRDNIPLDRKTMLEMRWVALTYSMPFTALLAQVISWAYFQKQADKDIRYGLSNPHLKHGPFARTSVNWSPELVAKFGEVFARCADKIKSPWPDNRDKMGLVIEQAWFAFHREFPNLRKKQPDLYKLAINPEDFRFFKCYLGGNKGLAKRVPSPPDEDGADESESDG